MFGVWIGLTKPTCHCITKRDESVFALTQERPQHCCRLDEVANDDRNENVYRELQFAQRLGALSLAVVDLVAENRPVASCFE
jgi:hypothetical protein